MQYALTGLWLACLNYNGNESSFETYAINNIRWSVFDGLNRNCSLIKYDVNNLPKKEDKYLIDSIDSHIKIDGNVHTDQHESIPSDENVEKRVMDSLFANEMLQILNDNEQKIVHMKSLDMTNIKIASKLNVSPQAISKAHISIQRKLRSRGEKYEQSR